MAWICSIAFLTSSVRSLPMVCTEMGASPPIRILPTFTWRVLRRGIIKSSSNFIGLTLLKDESAQHSSHTLHNPRPEVPDRDCQNECQQQCHAHHVNEAFFFRIHRLAENQLITQEKYAAPIQCRKGQQVHQPKVHTDGGGGHAS